MTLFISGDGLLFKAPNSSDIDFQIAAVIGYVNTAESTAPAVLKDLVITEVTAEYSDPYYDLYIIGHDGLTPEALDATGSLVGNRLSRVTDGKCRVRVSHPWLTRQVSLDMNRINDNTYTVVDGYVAGSLGKHITDGMTTLIGSHTAASKPIFSVQDHATGAYTRNTNCWLYPVDLTAISPWNSRGGHTRAGTAITPRHTIQSSHYPLAVNDTIRFVAGDNTVITRTVTGVADSSFDLQIALLDSDLPASITPLKFAPANLYDYLPSLATYPVPVFATDSEERAFVKETRPDRWYYPDYEWGMFRTSVVEPFSRLAESVIGGDSGNPICMVVNNTPVLMSHWKGVDLGPLYHLLLPEIAGMLSTLGGGHSLSTVDLSAFINYDSITFNGVDEFLDTGLAMTGWTEFTLFERSTWLSNSGYDIDGFSYPTGGANGEVRMGRSLNGVGLFLGSGSELDWSIPASSIALGEETTLSLTSKSGGTARAYVNGVEIASRSESAWAITQTQATYLVGGQKEGEGLNHFSNKKTREYKIYNRQLTADEITYLNTKGISGTSPGEPTWEWTP